MLFAFISYRQQFIDKATSLIAGRIELRDISFRYADTEPQRNGTPMSRGRAPPCDRRARYRRYAPDEGRVDRSMLRYALEAITEDDDAAAAAGVHVTAEKLKVTVLSAAMTAFAGAIYCQYQMFISPDTVSGIAVSLQMVFAAVVGGLYVLLGPTLGATVTTLLTETLRIWFGTGAVGWDNLVYGTLLVLFIIFLPQGVLGSLLAWLTRARRGAARFGA